MHFEGALAGRDLPRRSRSRRHRGPSSPPGRKRAPAHRSPRPPNAASEPPEGRRRPGSAAAPQIPERLSLQGGRVRLFAGSRLLDGDLDLSLAARHRALVERLQRFVGRHLLAHLRLAGTAASFSRSSSFSHPPPSSSSRVDPGGWTMPPAALASEAPSTPLRRPWVTMASSSRDGAFAFPAPPGRRSEAGLRPRRPRRTGCVKLPSGSIWKYPAT